VLFGHHAIVLTLLAAGASPTLNNDRCLSPAMVCGYTGDEAMVAAFGQHGHTVESIGAKEIYADESINPEERPQLLWDVLTCLYLYKRPVCARAYLVVRFVGSIVWIIVAIAICDFLLLELVLASQNRFSSMSACP